MKRTELIVYLITVSMDESSMLSSTIYLSTDEVHLCVVSHESICTSIDGAAP